MGWTEDRRLLGRLMLWSTLGFAPLIASTQQQAHAQLPAAQKQPAQSSPSPPSSTLPVPSQPRSIPPFATAPVRPVEPRFVVVIDAAHGGTDTGASISEHLLEKDIVLSLSVRLRSTLASRGIQVVTTRESDTSLSTTTRAEMANHAAAAACVILHATATGSGVHLFTSSLSQTAPSRFLPWQSAQSASVTQSLRLSSEVNAALAHAEIPVMLGRTYIQPLDSLACPAIAIEIAPLAATTSHAGSPLADAEYQRRIIDATAGALQQWRNDWRLQP